MPGMGSTQTKKKPPVKVPPRVNPPPPRVVPPPQPNTSGYVPATSQAPGLHTLVPANTVENVIQPVFPATKITGPSGNTLFETKPQVFPSLTVTPQKLPALPTITIGPGQEPNRVVPDVTGKGLGGEKLNQKKPKVEGGQQSGYVPATSQAPGATKPSTTQYAGDKQGQLGTSLPTNTQYGLTGEAGAAQDLRVQYEQHVSEVDAGFANYYGVGKQAGFGQVFAPGDRNALPDDVYTGTQAFAYTPLSWLMNPNAINGGSVVVKPDGTPFTSEEEYLNYMGYIQQEPGHWVKGIPTVSGYGGEGGGYGGGGYGGYRSGSGYSTRGEGYVWRISP